jgi:RimJ/RimL family protein N-acetyltransferase
MATAFQGDKVTLRPFEPDDAQALREYLNHPDLTGRRCIPWGISETLPLSEQQVQGVLDRWASEDRGTVLAVEAQVRKRSYGLSGEATGVASLVGHAEMNWGWDVHTPSVSVCIAPDQQRRGYGSNALQLLLRYLFDYTPAHNVGCWVAEWNEPALAFLRHHGFHVGGRLRRAGIHQGRCFDLITTDFLRPEWKAQQGGQDAA